MADMTMDFDCILCKNRDKHTDAVILVCNHAFCRLCLMAYWEHKPLKVCPVCGLKIDVCDALGNLALKHVYKLDFQPRSRRDSESVCAVHFEDLTLICLDHQEPVCNICVTSERHDDHAFRPLDEAVHDLKEELQRALKPLREKLMFLEGVKEEFGRSVDHIEVQARYTEKQIKEQIKKFHLFLVKEEESRTRALIHEATRKHRWLKDKSEVVKAEIEALSGTVQVTEGDMKVQQVSFLLNYKMTAQRVKQRPLLNEPNINTEVLVDLAKHVGNLSYRVWTSMKSLVSYSPLVLDPNSKDPQLILSEDLTEVRGRGAGGRGAMEPWLPRNPERWNYFRVQGSEGLKSGTHSWEVDATDCTMWSFGVTTNCELRGQSESWEVGVILNKYYTTAAGEGDLSSITQVFPRLRATLDFDEGTLSFCDPQTNTHIYTIVQMFTGRTLFPYLTSADTNPVKIVPLDINVTTKRPQR